MPDTLLAIVEDENGDEYLYEYAEEDLTEYDDESGVLYLEIEDGHEVALGEEEEIDEDDFEDC